MPEGTPTEAALAQTLENVIRFARSGEKLLAAAATLVPAAAALAELRSYDPDLSPEVGVAFVAVQEALAALRRAIAFQDARFDAQQARIAATLFDQLRPPTEGDTP